MADLAYYLAGVVAVLAAVLKVLKTRGQRWSPGMSYLVGELVCIGVSAVLLAPSTLRLCARLEPLPNLTRLIGNVLTAASVFCMLGVLAYAAQPAEAARRRLRGQRYVFVTTAVVMAALLVTARTRFTVDFVNVYATHPLVVAYEVVFLAYVMWAMIGVVRLVYQVSGQAGSVFLRTGLRIQVVGAAIGLTWALWKITITLLKATTRLSVPLEGEVSSLLSAVAVLLIVLGATTPAWGPPVSRPIAWLRAHQAYRRLEPLWSALHTAVPDLELYLPDAGAELRLYRRIVEIRDTSLVLRVHFHPAAPAWADETARAAGITSERTIAVIVEAANLAGALEAHSTGRRYHADGSTSASPRELDADIDAESRWLTQVSEAFATSPIVESVRRRVRDELRTSPVSDRRSTAG